MKYEIMHEPKNDDLVLYDTFLPVMFELSAYLDHFHHHVKRHPAPLVEVCEVLVEQPLDLDSILVLDLLFLEPRAHERSPIQTYR